MHVACRVHTSLTSELCASSCVVCMVLGDPAPMSMQVLKEVNSLFASSQFGSSFLDVVSGFGSCCVCFLSVLGRE